MFRNKAGIASEHDSYTRLVCAAQSHGSSIHSSAEKVMIRPNGDSEGNGIVTVPRVAPLNVKLLQQRGAETFRTVTNDYAVGETILPSSTQGSMQLHPHYHTAITDRSPDRKFHEISLTARSSSRPEKNLSTSSKKVEVLNSASTAFRQFVKDKQAVYKRGADQVIGSSSKQRSSKLAGATPNKEEGAATNGIQSL